jgi:hypothetical protein
MKKSKVQVAQISLPNASTPAKRSFKVDLDTQYSTCRGFYVIRNSGTDYLRIEVADASGRAVMEPVNITHLTTGNTVKIKDRFFVETPFPGAKQITVNIENFVNATALQDTDILFLLDNEAI